MTLHFKFKFTQQLPNWISIGIGTVVFNIALHTQVILETTETPTEQHNMSVIAMV